MCPLPAVLHSLPPSSDTSEHRKRKGKFDGIPRSKVRKEQESKPTLASFQVVIVFLFIFLFFKLSAKFISVLINLFISVSVPATEVIYSFIKKKFYLLIMLI
jgi:hypothetical protein